MDGENSVYLRHALAIYDLPPIDISDIEQVKKRCEWYIRRCIEDDMSLTVAGVCSALGINRFTFYRWCIGETRSRTHSAYFQKLKRVMNAELETQLMYGTVPVVSGIFLLKNNFDYKDQSEMVLTPNVQLGDPVSPDTLERKYLEAAYGSHEEPEAIDL